MNLISANLNIMIKACEKASKVLIRDFGELEKLQVSKKGPRDFVTNSDLKLWSHSKYNSFFNVSISVFRLEIIVLYSNSCCVFFLIL